jgi:hypothetical protein
MPELSGYDTLVIKFNLADSIDETRWRLVANADGRLLARFAGRRANIQHAKKADSGESAFDEDKT